MTFAGHREDISNIIHAADAVLVPSINEAWSRVVPEAYASRCPVVASAVGGLPEIVQPGDTGWLAPAQDVAGFADHLAWIWSHPEQAARIAERASHVRRPALDAVPENGGDAERLPDRDGGCALGR
ncbi:glycosyltransferase family 4 protein [Achromobacter insuavis]